MAHDVFISHASEDKPAADVVCMALEAQGIRCWVASRDILPGADWGASIVAAIAGAKAFLLVFSRHASASPYIVREVERAVSYDVPLIPLRIENVTPDASLGYFLGSQHWLDAYTPPLERHLTHVVEVVRTVVEAPGRAAAPPSAQGGSPAKARRRLGGRWRFAAGAVAALAAAGAAAVVLLHPTHSADAAADPKCLVMAPSLPDAAVCRTLVDQGPAWEGCAASYADGDMEARLSRARQMIAGGQTGSDLYESSQEFRQYGAISHYWEMVGLCVAQGDVGFDQLSGATSFPTHYWRSTRALRHEIGRNWSGQGQALPDFLSNLQALCVRYKAARDKAGRGGGETLDCSS